MENHHLALHEWRVEASAVHRPICPKDEGGVIHLFRILLRHALEGCNVRVGVREDALKLCLFNGQAKSRAYLAFHLRVAIEDIDWAKDARVLAAMNKLRCTCDPKGNDNVRSKGMEGGGGVKV